MIKKHKGLILLVVGAIGLFALNYNHFFGGTDKEADQYSDISLESIGSGYQSDKIVVEIKGGVLNPGIYEVDPDLRVGDIVAIAGGLTEKADTSEINLASRISDEMLIVIPEVNETVVEDVIETSIVRIVVEIKGAVEFPGVYILYDNSRIYDLIDASGGLLEDADITGIELARELEDGESICIPEIEEEIIVEVEEEVPEKEIYVEIAGEVIRPGVYLVAESTSVKDLIYKAGGVTVNCDLSRINWDLVLVLGARIYIPSYEDADEVLDDSSLININKANLETLITLPGIGDILGQRIIDYRAEFGEFLTIEEIMNVSGIKESVYAQIKELITV